MYTPRTVGEAFTLFVTLQGGEVAMAPAHPGAYSLERTAAGVRVRQHWESPSLEVSFTYPLGEDFLSPDDFRRRVRDMLA